MPPLTEAQLAQRLHGLGSSDISAVCGENPFRGPHGVWLEKLELADPFLGNDATWLGSELEPIIAKRYTHETGIALVPGPGTMAHPSIPWAIATTDYEHADLSTVVECKYVGMRAMGHWTLEADGAPTYVQIQTQWQMLCRGLNRADVAVIFGGTAEFRIYEFHRDDAMISALVAIADRFWNGNILPRVAPPIDGSESARTVLATLYPTSRKPLRPAPPEAGEWFSRRLAATAREKDAKADVDLATNKLIEMIGDADGIEGDFGICTFKANVKGTRSIRMYPRKEVAA